MSDSAPAGSGTRSTRLSARAARFAATKGRTRYKLTISTEAARNGAFALLGVTADIVSHYFPTGDPSRISNYYAGRVTNSRLVDGRRI